MFDIGWSELLLIVILGVVLIGPKQMPVVAYKLGRWLSAVRGMVARVHLAIDQMASMAEAQELNKKILEQERKAQADAAVMPTQEVRLVEQQGNEIGNAPPQTCKEGQFE